LELIIIIFSVFFAVFLAVISIREKNREGKKLAAELLSRLPGSQRKRRLPEKNTNHHKTGWQILTVAGRLFVPKNIARLVDRHLAMANLPLKGEEFLALVLIIGLTAGVFFGLLAENIILGILAAAISGYLAFFTLRIAKAKRLSRFNDQIGDALVIISNSLRSGFSFLQAMQMVKQEMPLPISREFDVTLQEMNWGIPTEEALNNLTRRVDSEDLDLVVTALLIQRQVGGNLAEVIDNIANTIRERVRIKGEIKTLTAQSRISGLIIGLLPAVLTGILYLINPAYISILFTTAFGLLLISMALASQVVGFIIIKKIIDIKI
jgi:tight adherence protein B